MFATYNYTADKGKSFGLPKNPRRTSMELIISGEATGDDESTMYNVATIVDRCKVKGQSVLHSKGVNLNRSLLRSMSRNLEAIIEPLILLPFPYLNLRRCE